MNEEQLIEGINKFRQENETIMLTELEVKLSNELIKYKKALSVAVDVYNNEIEVNDKFDEDFLGLGENNE